MKTWQYLWRLICFVPRSSGLLVGLWLAAFAVPLLSGWLLRAFFDTLSGAAPARRNLWVLLILIVVVPVGRELVRLAIFAIEPVIEQTVGALLRRNLLARVLEQPGAQALSVSGGEALSRLMGDVDEVGRFLIGSPVLAGRSAFAVVAVTVMLRVNTAVTLVVLAPFVVVLLAIALTGQRIVRYRRQARATAGALAGAIVELFGAIQALKVAGAEADAGAYLRELNGRRHRAALRESLLNDVRATFLFSSAITLCTGLVLLLGSQLIAAGSFTVGDFTLFVFYLPWMADFTNGLGIVLARYKQAGVAFERMAGLLRAAPPAALVAHQPVYLSGPLPAVPFTPRDERHTLDVLRAEGLAYRHPGSGRGITDGRFQLQRGTLTVVTGRIGAGKTTLLRVLLGLLPRESGTIWWNGQAVGDPATFFVPPRCAYVPQVPRLFSETLRENVLLGLPEAQVDLARALRGAMLEPDLAQMPDGRDTLLGPRGVRLSGGQVQRTATARALVRDTSLLVLDDLSSALDVETEQALWEGLEAQRATHTILAVSHRRTTLQRANQVIVLRDGCVDDAGPLAALLERNAEMRWLWSGGEQEVDG